MCLWRRASTVLNPGFRDDGSSRLWWFGLMHLAILSLLVRAGMGLIPQNNEFWALYCRTITQLWTGQGQTFFICSVTELWAKNCEPWERSTNLKSCFTLVGCTAECQVTSQAQGNVQVHKMFDIRDVFRKMWTPSWRFGAGLNRVEQHVSCVTITIFKLLTSKRLQMLIISKLDS